MIPLLRIAVIVATSLAGDTGVQAAANTSTAPDAYLVSSTGVGAVRLGMTLDQARRALPKARFERTSDAAGAPLVRLTLESGARMLLWADEIDQTDPIDWSRAIATIEVSSAEFHTREGLHPGSPVEDVAVAYGSVTEIEKSDFEGRQFIEFQKQPAEFTFRLNDTGLFHGDSRSTTTFSPGAKILSIAVSTH
jgi:hypothetical protein